MNVSVRWRIFRSNFTSTIGYYWDSLALSKELNDISSQAQTLNNLGHLWIETGELGEAELILNKGLSLLESINAEEGYTLSLYGNLAHLYAVEQKWQEANEAAQIVLQISKRLDSPHDISMAVYNIGWIEDKQGNSASSLSHYLEVLEIAQKYCLLDISELALNGLGRHFFAQGDHITALHYFREQIGIEQKFDDKGKLLTTFLEIGSLLKMSGDLQGADDYSERAVQMLAETAESTGALFFRVEIAKGITIDGRYALGVFKRLKVRLNTAKSVHALADVYGALATIYLSILDRPKMAVKCFRQEINLLTELDLREEQIAKLNNLGIVYEDAGKFAEAFDTYSEVIELARLYDFTYLLAVGYYNRARCLIELDLLERAEEESHHSLELASQLENRKLQAAIRHNLGELYRRSGQIQEAVSVLSSSVSASREAKDIDSLIHSLNSLGLAYEEMNSEESAISCFNEAIELSRSNYRKSDESNSLISLGNLYLGKKDFQQAKVLFEQALGAARSVEDIEKEEGSILSLAYAHERLGTFAEISTDFNTAGERAGKLNHYENLLEFLLIAGRTDFKANNLVGAAQMFKEALVTSLIIGLTHSLQLQAIDTGDDEIPEIWDFMRVLVEIIGIIQNAVNEHQIQLATDFYKELRALCDASPYLTIMNGLLTPIEHYLDETPPQSLWGYIGSQWKEFE